jgi:hypothetical protein
MKTPMTLDTAQAINSRNACERSTRLIGYWTTSMPCM